MLSFCATLYFAYAGLRAVRTRIRDSTPLYFKASSPSLENNHHPTQLVMGVVFSAVKRMGNEADSSPHMPFWLPQGQIFFAYYNPRPSIFIKYFLNNKHY